MTYFLPNWPCMYGNGTLIGLFSVLMVEDVMEAMHRNLIFNLNEEA